jgi:hypothetical protein
MVCSGCGKEYIGLSEGAEKVGNTKEKRTSAAKAAKKAEHLRHG